jgi:hypothetical protein
MCSPAHLSSCMEQNSSSSSNSSRLGRCNAGMACIFLTYVACCCAFLLPAAPPACSTGGGSSLPQGSAATITYRLIVAHPAPAHASRPHGGWHSSSPVDHSQDTYEEDLLAAAAGVDVVVTPPAAARGAEPGAAGREGSTTAAPKSSGTSGSRGARGSPVVKQSGSADQAGSGAQETEGYICQGPVAEGGGAMSAQGTPARSGSSSTGSPQAQCGRQQQQQQPSRTPARAAAAAASSRGMLGRGPQPLSPAVGTAPGGLTWVEARGPRRLKPPVTHESLRSALVNQE